MLCNFVPLARRAPEWRPSSGMSRYGWRPAPSSSTRVCRSCGADEDTAKWLHGQAVQAFPQFADMDPKDFVQLLSASEIALGAALLGIGFVPSSLAGCRAQHLRGLPDPALPHRPGHAAGGHHRPQPAGRRPGQGLLDAGHRRGPGAGLAVRLPQQQQEEVLAVAPRGTGQICDSSGVMRVLAVVAALSLAVAAPAAGAPSLASSGCPLFPADNVWHADVSRPAGAPPVGGLSWPRWGPGPASTPTSAPGPGRAGRSASPTRSFPAARPGCRSGSATPARATRGRTRSRRTRRSRAAPTPAGTGTCWSSRPAAAGCTSCSTPTASGAGLAGRVGRGVGPALQPAATGGLDLGRRRRPADPGRAGPLRGGGQGPDRPCDPGHRRPQPGQLPVAGPPPGRAGRRGAAADGAAAAAQGRGRHRRVPRPGQGDPAGHADLWAGGGRQRLARGSSAACPTSAGTTTPSTSSGGSPWPTSRPSTPPRCGSPPPRPPSGAPPGPPRPARPPPAGRARPGPAARGRPPLVLPEPQFPPASAEATPAANPALDAGAAARTDGPGRAPGPAPPDPGRHPRCGRRRPGLPPGHPALPPGRHPAAGRHAPGSRHARTRTVPGQDQAGPARPDPHQVPPDPDPAGSRRP